MELIDYLMSCYVFSISFEFLCTYQSKIPIWGGGDLDGIPQGGKANFDQKYQKTPPWGFYSVINTQNVL